jgi:hypothetical protein
MRLHDTLHGAMEHAPVWVHMLSAGCLGLGTMTGYRRRIVTSASDRQAAPVVGSGAPAELVGAALNGTAGPPAAGEHNAYHHLGCGRDDGGSGARVQRRGGVADSGGVVARLPATILLAGG